MRHEIIRESPWATIGELTANTGDKHLFIWTTEADSVLLVDGLNTIYLMEQVRPESEGRRVLKTVGGYKKDLGDHYESTEDCLNRNLMTKVGVKATNFVPVGHMLGYGDVIRTPISLYRCEANSWEVVQEGSCKLVPFTVQQAKKLLKENGVFDDTTYRQVSDFLLSLNELL